MKDKYYRQIPEISKKGKNVQQKPIVKRLNQIITNRLNKKEELKEKYQPTFKPEIDPHVNLVLLRVNLLMILKIVVIFKIEWKTKKRKLLKGNQR